MDGGDGEVGGLAFPNLACVEPVSYLSGRATDREDGRVNKTDNRGARGVGNGKLWEGRFPLLIVFGNLAPPRTGAAGENQAASTTTDAWNATGGA